MRFQLCFEYRSRINAYFRISENKNGITVLFQSYIAVDKMTAI